MPLARFLACSSARISVLHTAFVNTWVNVLTHWTADLPALGQVVEPPRRNTPALPPGLFPPAPAIPTADQPLPVPSDAAAKVPARLPDMLTAAPQIPTAPANSQHRAPSVAIPPAPFVAIPLAPVAVPMPPVAVPLLSAAQTASHYAEDPTPAEATASRRPSKPIAKKVPAPKTEKKVRAKGKEKLKSSVEEEIPREEVEVLPEMSTDFEKPASSTPPGKASPNTPTKPSSSRRAHPGKLNIDTSPAPVESAFGSPMPLTSAVTDLRNRTSRTPSISAASLGSRPGTPLDTNVATGSPLRKVVQPRTLRITDTPRTETPPALPSGSATEIETVPPLPAIPQNFTSRRGSIASLNTPGTPITDRAETMSITSTSLSRASSPPPITGKKARKRDARKREKEAAVANIVAPKEPTEADVGPIMARKVKSKKSKIATTAPAPKPAPPPVIEEKKDEEPQPPPPPTPPKKITEEVTVLEPTPAELLESVSKAKIKAKPARPPTPPPVRNDEPRPKDWIMPEPSAAAIVQAVASTHKLALSTLSMLKPLSSQAELKRLGIDPYTAKDLQNYIEQLRFELDKTDEGIIAQSQPIHRDLGTDSGAGRISGSCFISSAGTRLSHLTKEEADRYDELEKRVRREKGTGKWAGAQLEKVPKQSLKKDRKRLRDVMRQEDVLRALDVATETLESALRDIDHAPGSNGAATTHQVQPLASIHLAPQAPSPHPQDPSLDAREYINKFVPRAFLFDTDRDRLAVPENEDTNPEYLFDNLNAPAPLATSSTSYPPPAQAPAPPPAPNMPGGIDWANTPPNTKVRVGEGPGALEITPQIFADAAAASGISPRPELGLPPPTPGFAQLASSLGGSSNMRNLPNLPNVPAVETLTLPPITITSRVDNGEVVYSSGLTESTEEALDTLTEAMATAGVIAKLGANEALRNPEEVFRGWDRAIASAASSVPGLSRETLQEALDKALKGASGAMAAIGNYGAATVEVPLGSMGAGAGAGAGGGAPGGGVPGVRDVQSMAERERESLREKVAEAKREAMEWEKRVNKLMRGNRKLALGAH